MAMLLTRAHLYFGTTNSGRMREMLLDRMKHARWNTAAVAAEIGIHPNSLSRIIKRDPVLARARLAARVARFRGQAIGP